MTPPPPNDEKRQSLKIDSKIIFYKRSAPAKKIHAKVTDLKSFPTFKALFDAYPAHLFGDESKSAEDLLHTIDEIYSKEKQEKYGAPAIAVSLRAQTRLDPVAKQM